MAQFSGFSPAARDFLIELSENNNRPWFAENKPRYDQLIMQPALEFVQAMEVPLRRVSPHFTAIAKRQGGSIMRIYRDIRFSKNKAPYKTNLGIHFRHELGGDVHAPGFYFHVSPDSVFLGGGIWQPAIAVLAQLRAHIDEEGEMWKKIKSNKKLQQHFYFDGTSLKRPPQGYDPHHPLIEDLKRKDHFVTSELSWDEISASDFTGQVIQKMKIMFPYLRFLCDALRLPS